MLDILSITGPIYFAMAIGFAATRLGLFARTDMRIFGKFVVNPAIPALLAALIFHAGRAALAGRLTHDTPAHQKVHSGCARHGFCG